MHHHSISPCKKNGVTPFSTTVKPGTCADKTCTLNNFMTTNWNSGTNYGGVFGIAKDGHVIFGPYNKDGELWGCDDVDACNGFRLSDGSYGYATTTKFPYVVGCFGPAPSNTKGIQPSCKANACIAAPGSSSAFQALQVGLISSLLTYLVLI